MEEVAQASSSISQQGCLGKSGTMTAAALRISKTLLICLGFLIFVSKIAGYHPKNLSYCTYAELLCQGLLECSKGPALIDFSELMNVDFATISYLFITRSVGSILGAFGSKCCK